MTIYALGPFHLEQAVRAGLELYAAVATLRAGASPPMRCRVGIATGMVILGGGQGCSAEARDLPAPACNWFTESFDTPDLKEAKALLDALR